MLNIAAVESPPLDDILNSDWVRLGAGAIGAVVAVVAAVFLVRAISNAVVDRSSRAIRRLVELNATHVQNFQPMEKVRFEARARANSKPRYDSFDLHGYLRDHLLQNEASVERALTERRRQNDAYKRYMIESLTISDRLLGTTRPASAWYARAEQKRFRTRQLPQPDPRIEAEVIVTYTSPQGRNTYAKHRVYNLRQLQATFDEARSARARMSATQAMREKERRLMTPKLRADILRRDNYRCRMCGVGSRDGAVLHIDHIVPVSRGGRTEPSNLQVLCQSCNLGKSNRFVG